jgi:hypothetical protein
MPRPNEKEKLRPERTYRGPGVEQESLKSGVQREAERRQRAEKGAYRGPGTEQASLRGQGTPKDPERTATQKMSGKLREAKEAVQKKAGELIESRAAKGSRSARNVASGAKSTATAAAIRGSTRALYASGWGAALAAGIDVGFIASDISDKGKANRDFYTGQGEQSQSLFGTLLSPTSANLEGANPSGTRGFRDFIRDPEGVIGPYNPFAQSTMQRNRIRKDVLRDIPSGFDEGEGPNRSPYGERKPGNRQYIESLDAARSSVGQANTEARLRDPDSAQAQLPESLSGFASDQTEAQNAEFRKRLDKAGLLTEAEQVQAGGRERQAGIDSLIQTLGLESEQAEGVKEALNAFSEVIAQPGVIDTLLGGNASEEEIDAIGDEAVASFANLNLSEGQAQNLLKRLADTGISPGILKSIGTQLNVSYVQDQEGRLRTDFGIAEGREQGTDQTGQVIYAGMRDGVFVAQDTPGPGLTAQYTVNDSQGNLRNSGETSFGDQLRAREGPGIVRPGAEPGDTRARQRIFDESLPLPGGTARDNRAATGDNDIRINRPDNISGPGVETFPTEDEAISTTAPFDGGGTLDTPSPSIPADETLRKRPTYAPPNTMGEVSEQDLRAKRSLLSNTPSALNYDQQDYLNAVEFGDSIDRNLDTINEFAIPSRAEDRASARGRNVKVAGTENTTLRVPGVTPSRAPGGIIKVSGEKKARDFANRLRDPTQLEAINREAKEKRARMDAAKGIPGQAGANLRGAAPNRRLIDMPFDERKQAIYGLEQEAQANITAALQSKEFRQRVQDYADPGGNLAAKAEGRASVAADLAERMMDARRRVTQEIKQEFDTNIPTGLRDDSIERYRSGVESTRRARVKERRDYIDERAMEYTDDPALQKKIKRTARMYGLHDVGGDNDFPASFIEEKVSSVVAVDKVVDIFQKLTGERVSDARRRQAMQAGGYQGMLNLLHGMAGKEGNFYFRDASLSGTRIFNSADRTAWFDQLLSGISLGVFGDESDSTVIFENKQTGARIKVEDFEAESAEVKEMFQDFIDAVHIKPE